MSLDDIEILLYQFCDVYFWSLSSFSIPASNYYTYHSLLKAQRCVDQLYRGIICTSITFSCYCYCSSESESTANESLLPVNLLYKTSKQLLKDLTQKKENTLVAITVINVDYIHPSMKWAYKLTSVYSVQNLCISQGKSLFTTFGARD